MQSSKLFVPKKLTFFENVCKDRGVEDVLTRGGNFVRMFCGSHLRSNYYQVANAVVIVT